ncbi:MAG: TolC family protein [Planctomycetia bacterium]|nr:TolC family protein [Planctomycetia bacterium]
MANQHTLTWPLIAVSLLVGCKSAHKIHDLEYAQVEYAVQQAWHATEPVEQAVNPVYHELAGPQPLEAYVNFALSQNAGVQAARKSMEAAAMRVPQAASLKDPMLSVSGWPFYPNVPQTAAGRVTAEAMVSQEVPWFGKLRAQSDAAEAEVNMARAQLAAVELEVIEQVSRTYYELYFVEQSARITEQNRNLLADVLQIADARYRTSTTSQQDVLRLQAELSSVDSDIVRLRQERDSARAELAQLLHVSPETPFETTGQLVAQDVPRDLDRLYKQAISARPELHEQLAAIERDRFKAERAQLEYFPDLTFGAQWGEMTRNRALAPSADGLDMVGLNISGNLPVYRNRISAGVREAEAQVVASARQYDQMRDQTLRDVKSLFAQAKSQQEMAQLFRESIIPKTQQALDIAIREYRVGTTEFVQMIDNWRELLRLQIMHQELEAQLRQTLASLERVVGGFTFVSLEAIPASDDTNALPAPAESG